MLTLSENEKQTITWKSIKDKIKYEKHIFLQISYIEIFLDKFKGDNDYLHIQ